MSTVLNWRPVSVDGHGPPISTSLTEGEAAALRELARGQKVLEVGAAYGFSAVTMAQTAEHIWSIDTHAPLRSFDEFERNVDAYGLRERVTPLVGYSHHTLSWLPAKEFGFIFIDGDHEEAGVASDITDAKRLLVPGGVMALHDYGELNCPGVQAAIDRLLPDGHLEVDTLWVWRAP